MKELDPTKITIGIELECLLVPKLMPNFKIEYGTYKAMSPYWEGHSDGSIADHSRNYAVYHKDKDTQFALQCMRDDFFIPTFSGKTWSSIEMTTAYLGRPITLDHLDDALDDLQNLLQLSDPDEEWFHSIQINSSCGAHLHLSMQGDKPMFAGIFNLARVRYRNWLRENRTAEDVGIFDLYYHRGSYSPPMRAGLMDSNRREFCSNLGVEWRGFHLIGVKSITDMRERLHAAFKAFAEAYQMSANITERKFSLTRLSVPKPIGIQTKTITIYNPFPKVIPCAI